MNGSIFNLFFHAVSLGCWSVYIVISSHVLLTLVIASVNVVMHFVSCLIGFVIFYFVDRLTEAWRVTPWVMVALWFIIALLMFNLGFAFWIEGSITEMWVTGDQLSMVPHSPAVLHVPFVFSFAGACFLGFFSERRQSKQHRLPLIPD